MASHIDEPIAKRQRLDEEELYEGRPRYKSIKLDMKKYDEWVRELSEDELVAIFDLGVKVKESVILTVDVSQKFMEKALSSQMQPIQETVSNIEKEIKSQVNTVQESVSRDVKTLTGDLKTDIQDALAPKIKEIGDTMSKVEKQVNEQVLEAQKNVTTDVCKNIKEMADSVLSFKSELSGDIKNIGTALQKDVNNVATRVPALNTLNTVINESEKRLTETLKYHEGKLDSISTALQNPNKKGARAEKEVLEILNENLRKSNFTFNETSRDQGKADIEADTPDGHKIMIEVKNWTNPLTKDAIESFERNLAKCPHFRVGILLSTNSGIARRSKGSLFAVSFNEDQKQYTIYVPNAFNERYLIVWSVVLAGQLANMQVGELGEKKTQRLRRVYEEFQKHAQRSKDCRTNLDALKTAMQHLEGNVVPILDTVDKATKDINKLLNK